jgi:small conductance mechanosensitive channel
LNLTATWVLREIQIFITKIETFERVIHIIPNIPLSYGTVSNYSELPIKRQDWVFGISYPSDIDQAKIIIAQLAASEVKVLNDPTPSLFVSDLADSSLNITLRVWVNNMDAPAAHTILDEKVKNGFDAQKISNPFPQMDVHMHGNAGIN